MAFNLSSWSQRGRDWGRGDPPPHGSIEYVAVGGEAFYGRPTRSGLWTPWGSTKQEITYTELDAADRWIRHVYETIKTSRQVHGSKIVSDADLAEWDGFIARWNAWRTGVWKLLGPLYAPGKQLLMMMSPEQKLGFDALLNESKRMHDRLVAKGMAPVPIPYAGELIVLLRTLPKHMTAAEMGAKMEAAIRSGERLLDENAPWWHWGKRADRKGLARALEEARKASDAYARSAGSPDVFSPGSPVREDFLRRIARIYIEAAGLYGIAATKETAAAELKDDLRTRTEGAPKDLIWMLVVAGLSYLGLNLLTRGPARETVAVGVPDAGAPRTAPEPEERPSEDEEM